MENKTEGRVITRHETYRTENGQGDEQGDTEKNDDQP